ncbi:sulfite exporter TauE/SafE family protein 5-like isoform X1 [Mangifera indica]|uniref:sulfite exporter TauE/SafE family protein 5-like isoform X1 n=1 Tax=Mangifera indica TaxID=29780 RepID=UPI001CFBA942|nr:sulfite exporter TauE/SafE family protein 5-like isoform X1 [Mangifera indica]
MNFCKTRTHNFFTCLTLFLANFVRLSQSYAKKTQLEDTLHVNHFLNKIQQWSSHQVTASTVIAGLLCFIAASISRAGGIGGGGLFIPILTLVAGLELKTATSFSAFMVTGGSTANVMYNILVTSSRFGGKIVTDYDIALLSQPCMLLGVNIGVICNRVFPEWLVTTLFAVFLAWSTFKTCRNGFFHWKSESESVNRCGVLRDESYDEISKGPLLNKEEINNKVKFPRIKLGVLVMIWLSFFVLYLLRGNRYGQGIITIKPCGVGYWIISSLQIPVAIVFTTWILCRKECNQNKAPNHQERDIEDIISSGPSKKLIFPFMALMAGIMGGLFGIGGGMLISPLLLHVGIPPEVTATTCSFMVFFSSTMSAFQYLLLGMKDIYTALIFAIICFIGSLVGLLVIKRAIQKFGRASLIVFSVSIVLTLSAILMTSFGALNVWRDYTSGKYMGFKLPC